MVKFYARIQEIKNGFSISTNLPKSVLEQINKLFPIIVKYFNNEITIQEFYDKFKDVANLIICIREIAREMHEENNSYWVG